MIARPFGEDGPSFNGKWSALILGLVGTLGAFIGWALVQARDVGEDRQAMVNVQKDIHRIELRLDDLQKQSSKTSRDVAEIKGMLRGEEEM